MELRRRVHAIGDDTSDYDRLIERIGDARFVLLGEATHGTHQFYRERAVLTARLVRDLGFSAVAVEGDWPDALRACRYVFGESEDQDAVDALDDFKRFPAWMWRNRDVVELLRWLRVHNRSEKARVGFYGLDLYSLHRSLDEVVSYLAVRDPDAAEQARTIRACFDRFGQDPRSYGRAVMRGLGDCTDEVAGLLARMETTTLGEGDDERFWAAQNARVAASAEGYYRTLFQGSASGWNLRDRHMAETLDQLAAHLETRDGRPARIVVWAHDSHVGDARATAMAGWGELNLGQLCRQAHPQDTVLVGFTTYEGTVTAAHGWDEPPRTMRVGPATVDSWESLLHAVDEPRFWLDTRECRDLLEGERLHRFIGVVYTPEDERRAHYFETRIADQYDAVVHLDVTHAVEALDRESLLEEDELPETYPSTL